MEVGDGAGTSSGFCFIGWITAILSLAVHLINPVISRTSRFTVVGCVGGRAFTCDILGLLDGSSAQMMEFTMTMIMIVIV